MTLTELIPEVEQLSAADKVKLIRVLAEKLDVGEDISPLIPHKTYHLYTPYVAQGAGAALMNALNADAQGNA
jgi:hypothetical protein